MSEMPGDAEMIDGAHASQLLDMPHVGQFDTVSHEIPRMRFKTDHVLYPQSYVEELAQSDEWASKVYLSHAAASFATSERGRHLTEHAITGHEASVDERLRSYGNAALSSAQLAEILHVSPSTVNTWKSHGVIPRDHVAFGKVRSIAPHATFDLYSWRKPDAVQTTVAETPPTGDTNLISRPEASRMLRISVSGFQKTDEYLPALNLSGGKRLRYPRSYIEALAASPDYAENGSPTRASRLFALQPEAARAIWQSEHDINDRMTAASTDEGLIATRALAGILQISLRTIRKWQAEDVLAVAFRDDSDKAYATAEDVQKLFSWTYPAGYGRTSGK